MYSSNQLAKTLRVMNAEEGAEKTAAKFFVFVERYNLWDLVPSVLNHLEGGAESSDEYETLKIRVPKALGESGEKKIREYVGAGEEVE